MSDRTLKDVLIKELETEFLKSLLESLHEMYKDTCVGEIFEKFYFFPAHHYLLDELEDRLVDAGEYVDDNEDELEKILHNEDLFLDLYETYSLSHMEWEEGTYDRWERRFGEEDHYTYERLSLFDLEEVESGVFGYVEEVLDSIVTDYVKKKILNHYLENAGLSHDSIQGIENFEEKHTSWLEDNGYDGDLADYLYGPDHAPTFLEERGDTDEDLFKKYWSAHIKMQVTFELGIEEASKIFKPLEAYEFGLLDDTVPLEVRADVAVALVRAISTSKPEWVYANSLSRMYSATSYEWFKEDFFPTLSRSQIKQSPLNPLYLLMRVEDMDEAKELSEMGCRVAVTSRFANEHNLSEASFIDLIYVDTVTKSVKSNVDLVSICNSFQSVRSYYVVESCMPSELIWDGAILPNSPVEIIAPGKDWTIFTGVEPFDVKLNTSSALESVTLKLGFGTHSIDLAEIMSPTPSDEFEINIEIPNEILIKEDIGVSDLTYWEFLDACYPTIFLFQTLYLEKYIEMGGSLQIVEEKMLDLLDKSYPNKIIWKRAFYDLAFRDPSISAVLEVWPSEYWTKVDPIIYYSTTPSAPYVVEPLGNVKIVYYTSVGIRLPNQKVSSRLRYSQANYSLENLDRIDIVEGLYGSIKKAGLNYTIECSKVMEDTYGFPAILPYIGYKSTKKMYKNSNFIAYSYIYLFLPQILGRFGEHVAEDVVSQTLPLGSVISLYFKEIDDKDTISSIAHNPREFLDLAKKYTECAVNPTIPAYATITTAVPENYFLGGYLTALEGEALAPYNCVLRFMYSFIDTYTKPLAILYNALQFAPSSSSRANPVLRSEKKNITNNYSLNYSDGSWVDEYMKAIKESQTGEGFGDLIQSQSIPSKEAIQQEIEYFTRHAEVKEYAEVSKIVRTLKDVDTINIRNAGVKFPAQTVSRFGSAFRNMYSLINTGPLSKVLDSAEMKGHRTVYDAEGEFFSGVFNTQLTASITFIGKLASFVVGTFVGADKDSRFYKLFLTGSKSPSAPVKNTADFRQFLEYPLITNKITRILQNPKVSVGDDTKLPFTVANLSKNLVPLDFIRYMISEFFSDTYTYAPLGMDQNTKLPSKLRMSLGAFATIYTSLNAANQVFLNLQSASQYGPVQAAFGEDYVSFDELSEETEDASEIIGTQYTVRQQTASWDEYSESVNGASDSDIKERLESLTGAFQICIGQSGMGYIESAQEGNLEVFTFFKGDNNLSTLGFSYAGDGIYTIEDTKGENNKNASSNNAEGCQFILNWLADVVLEYIVPESLLRSILDGAREVEFKPVFEIDFDNYDIRELFNINAGSAIQLGLAEEESGRVYAGLCTRLSEIFADYTQAQVQAAIPTLQNLKLYLSDDKRLNMYGEIISFFDLLFDMSYVEERPIEFPVAGLSPDLLDNKLHVRFKPLFRDV